MDDLGYPSIFLGGHHFPSDSIALLDACSAEGSDRLLELRSCSGSPERFNRAPKKHHGKSRELHGKDPWFR